MSRNAIKHEGQLLSNNCEEDDDDEEKGQTVLVLQHL